jgi:hypothetical protein
MSERNTINGWYWMIQYRDSFRISLKSRVSRNLASRFASRSSTRDKKLIPGHIPLSSIPLIVYIKSLKGPLCLTNAFIFIPQKLFYFWYTFLAQKSYSLANYPKHNSSAAFLQFVQLKRLRILYRSQIQHEHCLYFSTFMTHYFTFIANFFG